MLKVILIILAVYAFCILVLPALVLHFLCDRHIDYRTVYTSSYFGMPEPEQMTLITEDGLMIWAQLYVPENVRGVIVIVSGIDGPSVTSFNGYAREFLKLGLAVYMPELRAHGPSEGKQICLAYKETLDVKAVCDAAYARFPGMPLTLMGLSMGAATVLRATGLDDRVSAVVAMSAYSSVQDFIFGLARKYAGTVPAYPLRWVASLYCSWKYGIDASEATPVGGVSRLNGRPLLLVHSAKDNVVPYYCFERNLAVARAASDKVRFITVPGRNHFIIGDFRHPEKDRKFVPALLDFLRTHSINIHP